MNSSARRAFLLGWAGVLPFLISAMCILSPDLRVIAVHAMLLYAALILSFLGGVHWGIELNKLEKSEILFSGYFVSVVPALLGFLSFFLKPSMGLIVLSIGFFGLLSYDLRCVRKGDAPDWYAKLRIQLTAVVLICLLVAVTSLE
ncbi:MAG: DUF3429 domain-containing protein [Hyphomicrobium sp.]